MSSSVDKSTELDDTQRSGTLEGDNHHESYDASNPSLSPMMMQRDAGTRQRQHEGDDREESNAPDNNQGDEDDDDEDGDEDDGDENEDKEESTSPHPSAIPPTPIQMPQQQQYGYGAAPHPYHGGYYMGYGPPPPGAPPPLGAMGGNVPPPVPDYGMSGAVHAPFGYADASQMNDPAPDTRRNRGGVTEPFPEKLHRMLDAAEREGLSDVVSFFPHGRAFAIHKPRRFVSEMMPRFFRQSRLTSFQRQLNLYGFRRISQGPDNGGYYHELFLKGRSGLCVNMKRTKVKGNQKLKRDPETEPNFYSYPPIKPPSHNMPQGGPPLPRSSGQPTPPRAPSSHPNGAATPVSPAAPPFYPPSYPIPYYNQYAPPPPYTAAQQNAAVYPYPPPYYGYPWGYPPPPNMAPQQQPSPQSPQAQQYHHHQHHSGATPQGTPGDTTPIKSEGDQTPVPPNVALKDEDDDDEDEIKPSVQHV